MLSNLLLSVWLVQIRADRNQIKGNMCTINPDYSQEDTGHHRGFSGPGTCIWKMRKDLFTTVRSGQLPQWHNHLMSALLSDSVEAEIEAGSALVSGKLPGICDAGSSVICLEGPGSQMMLCQHLVCSISFTCSTGCLSP